MIFFRNMVFLFLVIFLFNSCAVGTMMPMANRTSFSKVGKNLFSVSGEIINMRDKEKKGITEMAFGDFNFPFLAISYWKKIDKDISYEFYILGLRRIANIYRNGAFYLDDFFSIYSLLFYNGANIGFTAGLKFKHINIYTSTKFEPYMIFMPSIDGSNSGLESFITFTSALGVSYSFKSFSLYLEASAIVWDREFNKVKDLNTASGQIDYMISLGAAF